MSNEDIFRETEVIVLNDGIIVDFALVKLFIKAGNRIRKASNEEILRHFNRPEVNRQMK